MHRLDASRSALGGRYAQRAQSSPANSLFNRLGEFVHQLQASKDFFLDWPQLLCNKIRQRPAEAGQATSASFMRKNMSMSHQDHCWNGHDFSG